MKKFDSCTICNEFVNTYEDKEITEYNSFLYDYKKLIMRILRNKFYMSRKASWKAVDTLGDGNWKHLWETETEKEMSKGQIANEIIDEIAYCCDRWTWDRVLRVNWRYLRLKNRLWREENKGIFEAGD